MQFYADDFHRRFYTDETLGALWSPEATVFRVWAPEATQVKIRLYQGYEAAFAPQEHGLEKEPSGIWQGRVPGNLSGLYYTVVTHYEGRGMAEGVDPYARAVGPQGQRGYLVDLRSTDPDGWADDIAPPLSSLLDVAIYELHVRDASSRSDSGIRQSGKFLGLAEAGSKSPQGIPTGLDHIASLGVTHVHLLPVYDFDGVDDLEFSPSDYNWGYNPRNFNAVKLSYASDARRPETALRELKILVQTFHKRGLRVVLDMVYNHTYATLDSHLNRAYPYYYYRMHGTDFSNGSGCGNELATERPMVRKYILDSLRYWRDEFHIDGFRFDLMGLYDLETMQEIQKSFQGADPSFLLYGEGWTGGLSTLPEDRRAVKNNAYRVPGIAFFSDENRDAWKGHVFEVEKKGFVNGGRGQESAAKFAVSGCTAHPALGRGTWATGPAQVINYVAAHDNHTLFDKLTHTNPRTSPEDRKAMAKLAHAAVFLSQGIPFLHAGEEFLRSKQGVENSYNSSDEINGLAWSELEHHSDMVTWIRRLIALRKRTPELRLPDSATVALRLQFPELLEAQMISWIVGDWYFALNANSRGRELFLPTGNWMVELSSDESWLAPGDRVPHQMVDLPGFGVVALQRYPDAS